MSPVVRPSRPRPANQKPEQHVAAQEDGQGDRQPYGTAACAVSERTSLVGSTGNMSVTSSPPGLISFAQVSAHCSLTGGCRAHKNLRRQTAASDAVRTLLVRLVCRQRHEVSRRPHGLEASARVVEADVERTALRLVFEEVPCHPQSQLGKSALLMVKELEPLRIERGMLGSTMRNFGAMWRSPLMTCACAATSGGSPISAWYASALAICRHH